MRPSIGLQTGCWFKNLKLPYWSHTWLQLIFETDLWSQANYNNFYVNLCNRLVVTIPDLKKGLKPKIKTLSPRTCCCLTYVALPPPLPPRTHLPPPHNPPPANPNWCNSFNYIWRIIIYVIDVKFMFYFLNYLCS